MNYTDRKRSFVRIEDRKSDELVPSILIIASDEDLIAGLAWKRTAVLPCYLFRAYFTARALLFFKGARFSIRHDDAFEC